MQQIIWEMWCKTPPTVKQVAPSLFNWNPLPVTIPKDMPAVLSQLLKVCVSTVKSSRPTFSTISNHLKKLEQLLVLGEQCYNQGNYLQAVKYFQKAADQRYAEAQFYLGVCYVNGQGVAKDAQQAVKYFKMAADQGNAAAQFYLGVCYANGDGVAKAVHQAVKYYMMAADQGHAAAQYNLGVCYADGEGVAKDAQQAVKYYKMAADQGHAVAQHELKLLKLHHT
jgi:TPR repeat protein